MGNAAFILFLLVPIIAVVRGVTIYAMWTWFAVPLGLPVLPLGPVIGMVLLLDVFLMRLDKSSEKSIVEIRKSGTAAAVGYLVLLLYGLVLHLVVS